MTINDHRITTADILRSINAYDSFITWAEQYADPQQAWIACDRADRLLWFCEYIGVNRRIVADATLDCVRAAVEYWPRDHQSKLITAIKALEDLRNGQATPDEARLACYAAGVETMLHVASYAAQDDLPYTEFTAFSGAAWCAVIAIAARMASSAKCGQSLSRALAILAEQVKRSIPWSIVEAGIRATLCQEQNVA